MEFDLTPEITDEIIFAMEDQTGHFLYDSAECRCVSVREESDEDDDRYFAIPVWDSVSGFRMMDRFAAQLRNPVVREELRSALSAGHGVFRNFKNILRGHPEVERLWYQFKERELRLIVFDWYNSLREYWGLERIGMEPEETADIVSQDFLFREFGPDDEGQLDILLSSVEREIAAEMPRELAESVLDVWNRIRGFQDEEDDSCVMVAENSEGEVVGSAFSHPVPEGSLLSAQLVDLSVFPEYRGLGIGKELLSRTIQYWTSRGYRWLLFSPPVYPSAFEPVLIRSGFADKGHLHVLDLSESSCH